MAITLVRLKANIYCDVPNTTAHDAAIEELIDTVIPQAIDYIDNDDIETVADLTVDLERAICKQIAYEFKWRATPGLTSQTFPDGSINKLEVGEWLEAVDTVFERYKPISFTGGLTELRPS